MKFGCDPEYFFAINKDGEDVVISPALLNRFSGLKFSSSRKHPVFFETSEFKWMMDGVAAEITLKKPYDKISEMYDCIQNALDALENLASKLLFFSEKIHVVRKPVIKIVPEMYLPYLNIEKIFQGFIYGCDADYDADDTNYVCETQDALKDLYRYGGGHNHVSNDLFYENILPAIRLSTIYVGTFCIANSPHTDLEIQRGKVYGRPARFRPQKYPDGTKGMEYRTPSNSWTSFSKELVEEMFNQYFKIENLINQPEKAEDILQNFYKPSAIAITTGDKRFCMEIQKQL